VLKSLVPHYRSGNKEITLRFRLIPLKWKTGLTLTYALFFGFVTSLNLFFLSVSFFDFVDKKEPIIFTRVADTVNLGCVFFVSSAYSLRFIIAYLNKYLRRGLNFSSRMSAKQFDYCNKCLKLLQITLKIG
jgi:hypothetical protein